MRLQLPIFIWMMVCSMVYADDTKLMGMNVPLTARDPIKVKSLHDLSNDLVKIKDLLSLSGGGMEDGHVAVFFSAFNSKSIFLRMSFDSNNLTVFKLAERKQYQKELSVAELATKKKGIKRWSLELSDKKVKDLVEVSNWIASHKEFDRQSHKCEISPDIQIYIITSNDISIIEHVISESLIDNFVNTVAVLMSENARVMNRKQLDEAIEMPIKKMKESYNRDAEKIVEKPFRYLRFATIDGNVGQTQKSFEDKIMEKQKIDPVNNNKNE